MREVSRAKVFARLIFIEIEQASGFFLMKKPPGGQLARVASSVLLSRGVLVQFFRATAIRISVDWFDGCVSAPDQISVGGPTGT